MQYTAQPAAPHARASRLPERVEASGEKQMQAIKEEKQGQNELNGGVEECTSLQAAEHHMKSAGSSDFSDSPRCGASQTAGGPSPPPATSAQFVTPVSTPRSFRGLPPATMPPRGSYFEGCVSTRVNQGEAGRRVDGPMPCTPLDRSRRLLMTTNKRGTPIPRKKENRHDGGGGSETWDAPGLLGFFREELMLLQERLEGCFSALRSGALSLASFSKWAILFFFVALLVLGCTLVCFSIVGAFSYYLLSVSSTPPPLHQFPVFFDFFPRITAALSQAHRGTVGASPPHGGGALDVEVGPVGSISPFEGGSFRQPPQGQSESALPPPATASSVQHAYRELFGLSGHSLASLEEPVAFATVPFSNRSWELLPGDEAMFAAPAPLISSHWPSQQQQHMQDLQQMQPMQQLEEETKLPEFTVDLILSLSVSGALNNSSSHRHRNVSPLMLSLLAFSHRNSLVARSTRPVQFSPCPFVFSLLVPAVCSQETKQVIPMIEGLPLPLVSQLKFARIYLYPPISAGEASLIVQPKPEGIRLFLVQHPYLAYLLLTLFLLAAAGATVCCCCCCCCGYLLTVAGAPNTLHPADEVGRTSAQQEALLACEEALPPQEEKAALEQPPTAEGLYEGWILREPDFSSFGNGGQQNLVGQCKNEASSSPEAPTLRLRAVGRRRSTTAS
ncbi:uncharacterized protein LOC34618020 [Cyclospora cayetanensis]|uniref:Uncharacterized protein LOC34618020 n=1 Tax=Cyclospora cayetanensis TaxID=88456 RepID=A0A6P6RQR6_9EIME|nr:uncharacterized protein LOC34618020 [Cyclospora cayetanensis]